MRNLQVRPMTRTATLAPGVTLTAAQKAVLVNKRMGNNAISDQNSTTRQLYDTLPLDGRTFFDFFNSVQTRAFPRTNLNQNKLQVGETMTVQRIYFCVKTFSAITGFLTNVITITTAALTGLYGGQFSFREDTITVMKPYSLSSQLPSFNHSARHVTNEWLMLDTNHVLPTDIQWGCDLLVPNYTALANAELCCVLEGWGTLFNPGTQL